MVQKLFPERGQARLQAGEPSFTLGFAQVMLKTSSVRELVLHLKQARVFFLEQKRYREYFEAQALLVIFLTEKQCFEETRSIYQDVMALGWGKNPATDTSLHYAFGFCFLRQGQYEKASLWLDRGFMLALKRRQEAEQNQQERDVFQSRLAMCFIVYGFACLQAAQKKDEQALREVQNLRDLLQWFDEGMDLHTPVPPGSPTREAGRRDTLMVEYLKVYGRVVDSLKFCADWLQAGLLFRAGECEKAGQLYRLCYEGLPHHCRRHYMSPYVFYALGRNHLKQGQMKQAFTFLSLAYKSVKPQECVLLYEKIKKSFDRLVQKMIKDYDLVLNVSGQLIMEKNTGYRNFGNQVILLDLLKLFLLNPGVTYSKEFLAGMLWKQPYRSSDHDNKIYVTIKRLRNLIEPDKNRPRYIFRQKQGYYFNKQARVLVEQA